MKYQENNVSTQQTFYRLWPMISPYKVGLCIAIIALVFSAVSYNFLLALLKPFLDDWVGKSSSNSHSVMVWMMPLELIGLMSVRVVTSCISSYALAWVSGHVVMNIRCQLFNHMMGLPVSHFDQESTGTLLSRITYDSDQVASCSSNALVIAVREGATIIGLFFMMFYCCWQLSLILVVLAPTIFIIISMVSKRFRSISNDIQATMGEVTTSAEQMLKSHKEVLAFGSQKIESRRFRILSNRMRQNTMKLVAASSISDPIIQLIASLSLAFVLCAARLPSIMDNLTVGSITVIFVSMFALMRPLKSLTNVNTQLQRGMAACQTIFLLLDSKQEPDNGTIELHSTQGNIKFHDVHFTYSGSNIPVLHDINFSLSKGKTTAIVGRSGSGKSTISKLITRFYDIQRGKILLDGHDLREYTLCSLRNQISLVSQNIYLFRDTIANNIAYPYYDYKLHQYGDIEKVASMAHVTDFTNEMSDGLNTVIGENGILLSGGQRQRIAIARALLRDTPILILDEATSALDIESELSIQSTLEVFRKNKAVLVITHRLSTIEKADEIIVLEHGQVAESGAHRVLLDKKGSYAQLHKMQFSRN
jgi:subfamily B ATP-binding cassette protein MsbA